MLDVWRTSRRMETAPCGWVWADALKSGETLVMNTFPEAGQCKLCVRGCGQRRAQAQQVSQRHEGAGQDVLVARFPSWRGGSESGGAGGVALSRASNK